MGEVRFPLPAELQETIDLINDTDLLNISLDEYNGVIGVVFGDQLMFAAQAREEVEAFLAGFFFATFSGQSLGQIKQDLAEARWEEQFAMHARDRIWNARRSRQLRQRGGLPPGFDGG